MSYFVSGCADKRKTEGASVVNTLTPSIVYRSGKDTLIALAGSLSARIRVCTRGHEDIDQG